MIIMSFVDDVSLSSQTFLLGTVKAFVYLVGFVLYYRVLYIIPKETIIEVFGQPNSVQYYVYQIIWHVIVVLAIAASFTAIWHLSIGGNYGRVDLVWLFWIFAAPALLGIYQGHRERYCKILFSEGNPSH